MINTSQILELISDSYSIPWGDPCTYADSFQNFSFKEGDEIALSVAIETLGSPRDLPFLIYNPAYNEKYSIFYIFFGFSGLIHNPSLLFTNESSITIEISENNIAGELIEWCEEGYNSYFTFLDHKLDGYCEYKLLQLYFPERGFCKDGKKEGLWETDLEYYGFLEDDLDFFPLQVDVYKNDVVTKTVFIESKKDYETYLSKSNLPRIQQKKYGFYNMSALDWDKLREKYKLIQEDVYFKSVTL